MKSILGLRKIILWYVALIFVTILVFTFIEAKEDANVLMVYREIAQRVATNQVYKESEKARFFKGADPWLIASAKVWGAVVVTCETLSGVGTTKVKIPDICQQTGVTFVDLYTAMRAVQIVL